MFFTGNGSCKSLYYQEDKAKTKAFFRQGVVTKEFRILCFPYFKMPTARLELSIFPKLNEEILYFEPLRKRLCLLLIASKDFYA